MKPLAEAHCCAAFHSTAKAQALEIKLHDHEILDVGNAREVHEKYALARWPARIYQVTQPVF